MPDYTGNYRESHQGMAFDKGAGFIGEGVVMELFRSAGFALHDEIESMSHHVNFLTAPHRASGYRMPDLYWHSLTGDNVYLEVKTTTCGRWRIMAEDLRGLREWVRIHEGSSLYTVGVELTRLEARDPFDRLWMVAGVYLMPVIPPEAKRRWDPRVSLLIKNGGKRFTVRGLGVAVKSQDSRQIDELISRARQLGGLGGLGAVLQSPIIPFIKGNEVIGDYGS
jgi:hypothetical protein